MTATPEIAIIVPVYKVEQYLREALDSILAQTFTDWECILVDDGSPDACGAICDEYAAADPRFRVIHQANGGQGAARNAGINECRATFVTFVDSDDIVRPKYLARLHELITGYSTDMAEVGFSKLFRHRGWDMRPVEHITQLNQKEIINELLLSKMLPSYVWAKIFRRECIGPDFAEGMKFEDIIALAAWAGKIHSAVISPEPLYCYRQRRGSIMHAGGKSHQLDYVEAAFARLQRFHKLDSETINPERIAAEKWRELIFSAKSVARGVDGPNERAASIRAISDIARTLPAPRLSQLGIKTWRRAMLLLHAPHLFAAEARLAVTINRHRRSRNSQFFD